MDRTIRIHREAPSKPPVGQPCNGCGVCCLAEPCPLGMWVSRRIRGACEALVFHEGSGLYRCGLIEQPAAHLPAGTTWAAAWVSRLAHRYVAAGKGCDCDWETAPAGAAAAKDQFP